MFTEQQEQWLQALESGKYQQCTKVLKDKKNGNYRHCCLGIATELFGSPIEKSSIFESSCLSDRLVNDMEFRCPLGSFETPYEINGLHFHNLASLNDAGFSFPEIAALIRNNKIGVFR